MYLAEKHLKTEIVGSSPSALLLNFNSTRTLEKCKFIFVLTRHAMKMCVGDEAMFQARHQMVLTGQFHALVSLSAVSLDRKLWLGVGGDVVCSRGSEEEKSLPLRGIEPQLFRLITFNKSLL
jgi:hypothetical protein